MRHFWFLLVFAGCHPGSAVGPDAPDAPGDVPAPPRGLFIEWNATPPVPGPLGDRLTVTELMFHLEHLQITSDAGSSSTTRSRYVVAWNASDRPTQEAFPDAPAGVYSKVSLAMIGGQGDYSYRVDGTWQAPDDSTVAYRIEDRMPLILGLDCEATLSAGGAATLTIELDLTDAIEGIDFERLWDDGQTRIDLFAGPELNDFRDRLKGAFQVDDDDQD